MADENPIPRIKVVSWPRGATVSMVALFLALLLVSVSNIYTARIANRIETSAECRFDKNAEISDVNDEIDLWTARGLKALAEEDDEDLLLSLQKIGQLSDDFEDLIAQRRGIAEVCSAM